MISISKEAEMALFREYQNDNKKAFDRIFQQFKPLAISRVNKLIVKDCEHLRAELESEAIEALWKAAKTFDLKQNCRFSTYATKFIDLAVNSKMSQHWKESKRIKRYFQRKPVECIACNNGDDDGEIAVTDPFPCRNESILSELAPYCNTADFAILSMICNDEGIWHKNGNLNNAAIARKRDISRETVRQALQNLRSNRPLKSRLHKLMPR